jgi:hypothetical protein
MHALVMPIRKKEVHYTNRTTKVTTTKTVNTLDAKYFFDGSKKLSEMQTSFYHSAGRPLGLERGIKGSRARHSEVKRFYGDLESPKLEVSGLPEKGMLENSEKYTRRVERSLTRSLGKVKANLDNQVAEALQAKEEAQKIAEAENRIRLQEVALADQKRREIISQANQLIGERDRALEKANAALKELQEKFEHAVEQRRAFRELIVQRPVEEILETRQKLQQKDREQQRQNENKGRGGIGD